MRDNQGTRRYFQSKNDIGLAGGERAKNIHEERKKGQRNPRRIEVDAACNN